MFNGEHKYNTNTSSYLTNSSFITHAYGYPSLDSRLNRSWVLCVHLYVCVYVCVCVCMCVSRNRVSTTVSQPTLAWCSALSNCRVYIQGDGMEGFPHWWLMICISCEISLRFAMFKCDIGRDKCCLCVGFLTALWCRIMLQCWLEPIVAASYTRAAFLIFSGGSDFLGEWTVLFCLHECMYVCMYVRTYVHEYACVYMFICIYMYVYVCICMCVC